MPYCKKSYVFAFLVIIFHSWILTPARSQRPLAEYGGPAPKVGKPWETVAKVKTFKWVKTEKSVGYYVTSPNGIQFQPTGTQTESRWELISTLSGVVVSSGEEASFILTAHHGVRDEKDRNAKLSYEVALFDGRTYNGDQVFITRPPFQAKLVHEDKEADLALLRFSPGYLLPQAGFVIDNYGGRVPFDAVLVGSPEFLSNSCVVQSVPVLDLSANVKGFSGSFIEIGGQPHPGVSGGGLFTKEGRLFSITRLRSNVEAKGYFVKTQKILDFMRSYPELENFR